jgi:transcription-repair coupling factor (superfamily II helicase)
VILQAVERLLDEQDVLDRLTKAGVLEVRRFPGAAAAAVAAALEPRVAEPVVIVAETPSDADEVFDDLRYLAPGRRPRHFPQRETLPYEDAESHVEIAGQRIEALSLLLSGRTRLLVTTARALAERSALPAVAGSFGLRIATGDEVRLAELAARLSDMGFDQVHTIQALGEFAIRGGIVDVFPFGVELPVRIELWEDKVASLRHFDLLTQRSIEALAATEILPVNLTAGKNTEPRSLLELLPEGSILIDLAPLAGRARREVLWEETRAARRDHGAHRPVEALVLEPVEAERRIEELRSLRASETGGELGLSAPPPIARDMRRLVAVVTETIASGEGVLVLCDNEGQLERLEEILVERGGRALSSSATMAIGSIRGGFRIGGSEPLLVLTDHEIFRRSHRLRSASRFRGAATLESVASIRAGDYVVHMDHGIGRYSGLARVEIGGETIETLEIEYADGETLRLPHYRLDLIERWSATGDDGLETSAPPRVHKLGGKRWKQLKARTVSAIEDTALELLQLYAHRQVSDGHAFSSETAWQREMESAFLYDETPDQLLAWDSVRVGMEEPKPMDRLVCGDVGYGKTEIAIRAAFKAVQDGKQVALLAPTTILVDQHLHTFRDRLAAFPVRVESLSRFLTPARQRGVVEALASGEADVVIGTHRILSKDVRFADLGLLIVDEEQRFGVRQKERLKDLRRSVDVLTLTATPIPRTMQLALGGIRDLSLIQTPPRDRMPIITHVLEWNDEIIEGALRRELDRAGQVFFVHDRVETIEALAARVRRLIPDARVAVAHGQMHERHLEEVMHELMRREVDVLVCTSIIENGLDVATANTMIVHRADRFGLAQLYQLRGRVGRSHRRAYCYLVVPSDLPLEAEKRLRVLEHHTELGSGYHVALKDLEVRGAGNLLGAAQSGFASAVGLETYQRLVESTVRRLKGETKGRRGEPTRVSVDGEAFLPDEYILDSEQKMHLYRRLSRLGHPSEVRETREELRDRFGPMPEPAGRLLAAAELRTLGSTIEAEWIRVSDDAARVTFRSDATPRLTLLKDAFADRQVEVEVRRLQPLSLLLGRAGPEPLLPTLIDSLQLLATAEGEPVASATAGR